MSVIAALIAVAIVLLIFEGILPGGILGVVAVICVIVATLLTATEYGPFAAMLVFVGSVALGILSVYLAIKLFSKSSSKGGPQLRAAIDGHSGRDNVSPALEGKTGVTLTRMNPSGKVQIDDRHYIAVARDGFIAPDKAVKVVGLNDFQLIIIEQ